MSACSCCPDTVQGYGAEEAKAMAPDRGQELAAELRQLIRQEQGPAFQDGDVLRWLWEPADRYPDQEAKVYTYAALRAGGRWYVTGPTEQRQNGRTWKELQERLAMPGITDLTLATGWSAV